MYRNVVLLALFGLTGCDQSSTMDIEPTVPVTGIAEYQGKPLQGYKVFFSNEKNRTATGIVDFDGRFTLGTNTVGDGAPIGSHRIWLAYEPDVEVEAGKEEETLILPPSVEIPDKFKNPGTSAITVEVPPEGLTDYKLELE